MDHDRPNNRQGIDDLVDILKLFITVDIFLVRALNVRIPVSRRIRHKKNVIIDFLLIFGKDLFALKINAGYFLVENHANIMLFVKILRPVKNIRRRGLFRDERGERIPIIGIMPVEGDHRDLTFRIIAANLFDHFRTGSRTS